MNVFYVGGEKHVFVTRLAGSEFTVEQKLALGAAPSFLAFAPQKKRALVVVEGDDRIACLNVHEDGSLGVVNEVACAGGPAFVSVDPNERWVFTASYGSGEVRVYPLDDQGRLGEAVFETFVGKWAHAALLEPNERRLFVPCKGDDVLVIFEFDEATGSLTNPSRVGTRDGFGPRHVAFTRQGSRTYLIAENSCELAVVESEAPGAYRITRSISTLPEAQAEGDTGADVHASPDERFVYASNRGHDSIAVFSTAGDRLSLVEHVASGGRVPRNFCLDDAHLLVANQESGNVALLRRDLTTGRLSAAGSIELGERIFWVGPERAPLGA